MPRTLNPSPRQSFLGTLFQLEARSIAAEDIRIPPTTVAAAARAVEPALSPPRTSSSISIETAETAAYEEAAAVSGNSGTTVEEGREKEEGLVLNEGTARALFGAGVDSRVVQAMSKGKSGGSRGHSLSGRGRLQGEAKRRRSSGWFRRLSMSFQPSRVRSASEDESEEEEAGEEGVATAEVASNDVSEGTAGREEERLVDSVLSAKVFVEADIDADHTEPQSLATAGAGWAERGDPRTGRPNKLLNATLLAEVAEEGSEGAVSNAAGSLGPEAAEVDEEEHSGDETGSNTTEGFGSDDAGHLWDGGRATGAFEFRSPIKSSSDYRPKGKEGDTDSSYVADVSGNDSRSTRTPVNIAIENVGGEATQVQGCQGIQLPELLLRADCEATEMALSGEEPISVAPNTQGGNSPSSPRSVGDNCAHERGDTTNIGDRTTDHRRVDGCGERENKSVHASSIALSGPNSPRSPLALSAPRPSRPPSVLPGLKPEAELDNDILPPVVVEHKVLSPQPKATSSPTISESSSTKESPRAWRLSWWARASDRHRPPPPATGSSSADGELNGAGAAGNSTTAALAAAAGGEEVTAALPAGGTFVPSFNSGGVVVGKKEKLAFAVAAAVAAENALVSASAVAEKRRSRNSRSLRRRGRLGKPWLAADMLSDTQARPIEAASEYLDVTGLARAYGVCRAWGERLGGESGARRWMRCVRLPQGVPNKWRANFYLHILYDRPSWVSKVMLAVSAIYFNTRI